MLSKEELQKKVDELRPWHYCHIFPYGISTGDCTTQIQSEKLELLVAAGVFPDPVYETVLDLGANSGLLSMWFADNRGSTVTAVEHGIRYYPQLELAVEAKGYTGKVLPIDADITDMTINDEYDLVLNLGVLHHIAQPKHAVVYDLMYAALKHGGLVVIQTKNDQMVPQRLRQAGFKKIKQVPNYAQGDRLAWTATKSN